MFSSGKRVQKYNLFLNYQNIFSKKIINKYLHIEKQHIENQKKIHITPIIRCKMDLFTPQNGKKSRFLKQEILQIRQKTKYQTEIQQDR